MSLWPILREMWLKELCSPGMLFFLWTRFFWQFNNEEQIWKERALLFSLAGASTRPMSGWGAVEILEYRQEIPTLLFKDKTPLTKDQFWVVSKKALAKLGLEGVKDVILMFFPCWGFKLVVHSSLLFSPRNLDLPRKPKNPYLQTLHVFLVKHQAKHTAICSQLGLSQWATVR